MDLEKNAKYITMVISLIREKYSIDDEMSIIRQRDIKQGEFIAYDNFVEQCKEQAKSLIH